MAGRAARRPHSGGVLARRRVVSRRAYGFFENFGLVTNTRRTAPADVE